LASLETIPLLRQLNPAGMQILRTIAQECRFSASLEIFREGAAGNGI